MGQWRWVLFGLAGVLAGTGLSMSASPTFATDRPSEPSVVTVGTQAAESMPKTVLGLNVWDVPALNAAERALRFKAGIVGVFADFTHNLDFPTSLAKQIRQRGATVLVAWEPWDSWTAEAVQPRFQLQDLLHGAYDPYIRRWARQIKQFNSKVLVRFAPEMNGDWRPWSPGLNGNTSVEYIAAWRHVVDIFRATGTSNARWVWNPIIESGGVMPMADVYPGSNYVDWVALDGYNWGATKPWGWQTYDDVFAPSVTALKTLAPGKPWMIAETGSAPGTRKPEWIADTLSRARSDGARAVVWFEFNKETDWRLSENAATAKAARTIATSTGWLTGGNLSALEPLW